jgi:hypothetical protein
MLKGKRNTLWLMLIFLLLPAKLAFSNGIPNLNGTWKRSFGNDRIITFRLNGNNGAIIRPNGQSIPFTIIVSERDIKVSVRILFIRMESVATYTLSTDQRVLNLKASEPRFNALDGDYVKE